MLTACKHTTRKFFLSPLSAGVLSSKAFIPQAQTCSFATKKSTTKRKTSKSSNKEVKIETPQETEPLADDVNTHQQAQPQSLFEPQAEQAEGNTLYERLLQLAFGDRKEYIPRNPKSNIANPKLLEFVDQIQHSPNLSIASSVTQLKASSVSSDLAVVSTISTKPRVLKGLSDLTQDVRMIVVDEKPLPPAVEVIQTLPQLTSASELVAPQTRLEIIDYPALGIPLPEGLSKKIISWRDQHDLQKYIPTTLTAYFVRSFVTKSYIIEHCYMNKKLSLIENNDLLRRLTNMDLAQEGASTLQYAVTDFLTSNDDVEILDNAIELSKLLTQPKTLKEVTKQLTMDSLIQYNPKDTLLLAKDADIECLTALVGAIQLSSGAQTATSFVKDIIIPKALNYLQTQAVVKPLSYFKKIDYEIKYREHVQPVFKTLLRTPDPLYRIGVYVDNKLIAIGHGATLLTAQMDAVNRSNVILHRYRSLFDERNELQQKEQ